MNRNTRRAFVDHTPLQFHGVNVEKIKMSTLLCVCITEYITWSINTKCLARKPSSILFWWRKSTFLLFSPVAGGLHFKIRALGYGLYFALRVSASYCALGNVYPSFTATVTVFFKHITAIGRVFPVKLGSVFNIPVLIDISRTFSAMPYNSFKYCFFV